MFVSEHNSKKHNVGSDNHSHRSARDDATGIHFCATVATKRCFMRRPSLESTMTLWVGNGREPPAVSECHSLKNLSIRWAEEKLHAGLLNRLALPECVQRKRLLKGRLA